MKFNFLIIVIFSCIFNVSPVRYQQFLLKTPGSCLKQSLSLAPSNWNKTFVDPDRLAGRWYAIFTTLPDKGYDIEEEKCAFGDIFPSKNGWTALEVSLKRSKYNGFQFLTRIEIFEKTEEAGKYSAYTIVNGEEASPARTDWVIYLDYDNYIVWYKCETNSLYCDLLILSRTAYPISKKDQIKINYAIDCAGIEKNLNPKKLSIDQFSCPMGKLKSLLAKLEDVYLLQ